MTTAKFTLTVGRGVGGYYWARIDGADCYAVGSDSDAWGAALNAVHEAQFLIEDEAQR